MCLCEVILPSVVLLRRKPESIKVFRWVVEQTQQSPEQVVGIALPKASASTLARCPPQAHDAWRGTGLS